MPTLSQTTYTPQSFHKLWLWFAWLVGAGIPLTFIGIGVFLLIAGGVIGLILLYRFWSLIQDGQARTSPAQAVGFLFIPFFNVYWNYVAQVGLAKDMNTYCQDRNIPGVKVSEGLALTWFILVAGCQLFFVVIPYAGALAFIALVVIQIILIKQFADVSTRIIEARESSNESLPNERSDPDPSVTLRLTTIEEVEIRNSKPHGT